MGSTVSSLYPHQEHAVQAIAASMESGLNRLLVQMGTGSGKTRLAASLLRHPLMAGWWAQWQERDRRVLFFVHREEIVDQAALAFQQSNPGLMVSIEQGPRHANRYADVVVASIQTLDASNGRRLKDLVRYRPFRMVFADEAHRSTASSYIRALITLGFLPPEDETTGAGDAEAANLQVDLSAWDAKAPKDRVLIGLTATPNRSDGVGLSAVFQKIAFSFPLRKGIESGYLVPIVPWVIDTTTSLDSVRTNKSDFNQGDLQRTVNTEERNRLAVAGWLQKAAGRPTIAFTAGVQHAHDLAGMFASEGISARAVSGETPKDERRASVAEYRAGRVTVLCNDSVFTEGTDLPTTACVLLAKPTKSALTFEQMVGRGLRLSDGKKDCVLLDVIDVARKHSLMTAPTLYGLPPGLRSDTGKSLEELAEAWDAFAASHPGINLDKLGRVAIEQLQVKASTFNLWEVASLGAFGAGRAMSWVKISADSFRLSYAWQDGEETITVAPNLLGKFAASCTFRPHGGGTVRQRTLVDGLTSAVDCGDYAERWILAERRSVTSLTSTTAKWRKQPASERQKKLLSWKGIPFAASITMGEASALIGLAKARAGK